MENLVYSETEQSVWVEDYTWIGVIYEQDIGLNRTLITPLAFYQQNWRPITASSRNQDFPNNGKVVLFTMNNTFPREKANRLYEFWPKYNHRSHDPSGEKSDNAHPHHSHYLTREPISAPLEQVVDLSSQALNPFELPNLLEQGIVARDCLSSKAYVRYQDYLYGPLYLEFDQQNTQLLKPREYLQGSSTGGKLLLYGYPFSEKGCITLENKQFIDPQMLGTPLNLVDWSLPKFVIKSALRASNDYMIEEKQLVKKRIDMLANSSSAAQIPIGTIQRAYYIIHHQIEHLDKLQSLIEELPEENLLLKQARELEVQRRRDTIEQACEAEQSHVQALQEEVLSAQKNLAHLDGEIKQAEHKQAQMSVELAALETSMQKRLTDLRQEMLHLLTDLQLTSTLPSALFQTHTSETTPEAPRSGITLTVQPQNYCIDEKVITLATPPDLPWGDIAKQNRLSSKRVKACTSALLAGLIPVANSPLTSTILQAVAQMLAGQRIWRVQVPLTATSPLALFGRILTDQQSFLPDAGELADICIEAETHPEQLGFIVLEGIDRVPFLPIIEPLLRQYRTARRSATRTGAATLCQETLQLFHPRALALEDPYQKISRLVWPVNLLLGVTFDEDIGGFPQPRTYASWFAHIAHLETSDFTRTHWSGEQKNWQVSPTSWYAWEQEITKPTNSQSVLSLREDCEPWQQLFYAAMEFFGMKNNLTDIIEQLWPKQ